MIKIINKEIHFILYITYFWYIITKIIQDSSNIMYNKKAIRYEYIINEQMQQQWIVE